MRLLPLALGFLLCLPTFAQDAQKLAPPDTTYDGNYLLSFGTSVDVQVNWAVIGASGAESNTGAAYVSYYDGDGSPWSESTRLETEGVTAGARFGTTVSIDNRWIAVGANYDSEGGYHAGAVYVFHLDGSTWTQVQKILPPTGVFGTEFGVSVAIDDDALVIGALLDYETVSGAGAAYVYRYDGSSWLPEQKLTASDGAQNDFFGNAVAIDAGRIAVGAGWSDSQGDNSGAVYLFTLSTDPSNHWLEEDKVVNSDGAAGDHLGYSVALDGDVLVAGCYKGPPAPSDDRFGAAYVFRRSGPGWSEEAKLESSDGASDDYFGWTVEARYSRATSGYVAVVGAPYREVAGELVAGAAYVFKEEGSNWSEVARLTSPVPAWQENYGWAVAADETNLIVGASSNRDRAPLGGVAYVYAGGLLVVDVEDPAVVSGYRLDQNYPNPFNPVTTIRYTLPAAGSVSLVLYDLLGHEVRTLAAGSRPAGSHEIHLDASGLSSGVYLYRLRSGTHVESRSLVVLK